jgi:uncharacterized protein
MAELNRQTITGLRTGTAAIDEGLRAYMLRVYNYMAAGLAITGLVAYALSALSVTTNPALAVAVLKNGTMLTQFGTVLFGVPLVYILLFAPVAVVIYMSARLHTMSVAGAQLTFWIYAGLVGASLAGIFLTYTGDSIARVFFITATAFGGLSLYGYTTKTDLSPFRAFLVMGVIGLLIAMVVNYFLASPGLQFAISVIGVLVFAGLTAYRTQEVKESYFAGDNELVSGHKAIIGALGLYLAFLNMFVFLLSLFGNNR